MGVEEFLDFKEVINRTGDMILNNAISEELLKYYEENNTSVTPDVKLKQLPKDQYDIFINGKKVRTYVKK